jgi:hypothetical protein
MPAWSWASSYGVVFASAFSLVHGKPQLWPHYADLVVSVLGVVDSLAEANRAPDLNRVVFKGMVVGGVVTF